MALTVVFVIVVRAHNEQDALPGVLAALFDVSLPVVVADSGSTDATAAVARGCGARVVGVPLGVGAATVAVLREFAGEPVVFVDGDLLSVRIGAVGVLHAAAERGFVGKGLFDVPGRSSRLLAQMAEQEGVVLPDVPVQALTSGYSAYPAGFADLVDVGVVPSRRGSDLTLSLLADEAGVATVLVPVGPRAHNTSRGDGHIASLVDANREALRACARRRAFVAA